MLNEYDYVIKYINEHDCNNYDDVQNYKYYNKRITSFNKL